MSSPVMTSIRLATAAGVAAAALLLSGCAMQIPGGAPSAVGSSPSSQSSDAGATPATFDVCSFFPAAEVKQLIGSSPAGKARSTPRGGASCFWEDTENYHSLTVDIGDPDTAINGTLPAWDPAFGPERTLPGGMRDVSGAVEFVCAGTRLCSVQVANAIGGDADQKAAIALVERIRSKVGG